MEADLATGLIWFIAFLLSTTVHEAMHALVAWKGGDPTAYQGGQVSLSPVPHIKREPIGMLVVPLLTSLTQGWAMGWASAPYDPRWAERYPRRAALMAAAGPAGNFMIAAVALIALRVGLMLGWFVEPESVTLRAGRNQERRGAAPGTPVRVTDAQRPRRVQLRRCRRSMAEPFSIFLLTGSAAGPELQTNGVLSMTARRRVAGVPARHRSDSRVS
jgi:hypothetical protein